MSKGMKTVFLTLVIAGFVMTCGVAAAANVVIKFATGTPKTHPQDQGALFFADMVRKESNGEIDVQDVFGIVNVILGIGKCGP